ncbi:MAG: pilin [Shewanella sp.]
MIVVAIIAVLAAIAVPAYQNYIGKSQFATGLAQLSALKTPVEMYIVDNGKFPADASGVADTGLAVPTYDNGEVTMTKTGADDTGQGTMEFEFTKGTAGVNQQTITLTRAENGGWSCSTTVTNTAFVQGCTTPAKP